MPAKSQSQRRAAGTALAALRGETPMNALKGAAKDMMKSMSEEELRKMAHTSGKGDDMPMHVKPKPKKKGKSA